MIRAFVLALQLLTRLPDVEDPQRIISDPDIREQENVATFFLEMHRLLSDNRVLAERRDSPMMRFP